MSTFQILTVCAIAKDSFYRPTHYSRAPPIRRQPSWPVVLPHPIITLVTKALTLLKPSLAVGDPLDYPINMQAIVELPEFQKRALSRLTNDEKV